MSNYLITIVTLIAIASLCGLALNLQWGLGGLVNFGLFGFYMVAAYVCAIAVKADVPPLLALLLAVVVTAILSGATSLIAVRLSEDYLAIVTLGLAECVRLVVTHETWLTRGSLGISDISRPFQSNVGEAASGPVLAAFAVMCVLVVYGVFELLGRSPFGRVLRALREDAQVAATLGKNVFSFRWRAFALGGAALGIAGSLHVFYYRYIDPTQFGPIITAYAFMAVIVGGRGSHRGVLVAAVVITTLLEASRFLDNVTSFLNAEQLAALRLVVIGAALILTLILRPNGFGREYRLVTGASGDKLDRTAQ